ncbi:MAG: hypothetical protein J07HQW2_03279 [Haloquadratum walsbyi J07HQW2]|uniref:Transposase n=1 Tax=Haloquadratum walsbyi J07HQW2 TaxID=1238425 RepID=U1NHY5_9EURY|nr:hypothetical protein [Haloquadratum walsbyi]ERG96795.1 MAG: hypothetical protein J07HQW2_03279 [Haloquadratum walsbyi J07HQW2]
MNSTDAALFEATVNTFLWCAQYVMDHAFEDKYVTTNKTQLDDETYDGVREKTNRFNGGLVQAARNKTVKACKNVVEHWKEVKARKRQRPNHGSQPSRRLLYDHRTATFYDDYVSLATTDGRIEADYILPEKNSETPQSEYLFSDEYETTGAELHYRDCDWMSHIHCKTKVESDRLEQATTESGTVLESGLPSA